MGFWEIDRIVLRFIEANPDLPLTDIIQGVADEMTAHTARARVKNLVRQGFIHQKEDTVEHDWVYRVRAGFGSWPVVEGEE